jgi:hypothetical protein
VTAVAHHIRIGRTRIHPPIPGLAPAATCCAEIPGEGICPWHADAEHDLDAQGRPAVRAAAVAHAATGHQVIFGDATSTTVIEVAS